MGVREDRDGKGGERKEQMELQRCIKRSTRTDIVEKILGTGPSVEFFARREASDVGRI